MSWLHSKPWNINCCHLTRLSLSLTAMLRPRHCTKWLGLRTARTPLSRSCSRVLRFLHCDVPTLPRTYSYGHVICSQVECRHTSKLYWSHCYRSSNRGIIPPELAFGFLTRLVYEIFLPSWNRHERFYFYRARNLTIRETIVLHCQEYECSSATIWLTVPELQRTVVQYHPRTIMRDNV